MAVILVAPSEGDPLVFLRIADPIANGGVAYRDVPIEYPPLALLPLVLPRVIVGVGAAGRDVYFVFGAIALATTLVCGGAVSWLAARGWSRENALDAMLLFVAIAFALSVSVIWRFDILPAALTALALVALAAGRPGWAGVALALAVAVKLYPGFLVPIFLAYYAFNGRWRSAAFFLFGFGVTLGAIVAQIYLVAGSDAFSFLTYQRDRGTELESVVGGLALAADAFLGNSSPRVLRLRLFRSQLASRPRPGRAGLHLPGPDHAVARALRAARRAARPARIRQRDAPKRWSISSSPRCSW